uniref:Uncharacterized protein n=1 Tax=Nomascus leucogenys TaxID=61853 RepID=A0A2I3HHT4_NOMLE
MDALCGSGELGSKFWVRRARESEAQCSAPSQHLCRVRKERFAISRGFVMEGLPSASTEV